MLLQVIHSQWDNNKENGGKIYRHLILIEGNTTIYRQTITSIMNIIPYEEFQIEPSILNRLKEAYAERKVSEYFEKYGVLPDEHTSRSFYDNIPNDLIERYKRYFYSKNHLYYNVKSFVSFSYELIPDELNMTIYENGVSSNTIVFEGENLIKSIGFYKLLDEDKDGMAWGKYDTHTQVRIDNWLNDNKLVCEYDGDGLVSVYRDELKKGTIY